MVLLLLSLSSCATRPPQPVPRVEAQVKTAVEAQALAMRWVRADSSAARELRLEAVEVHEQPEQWQVWLLKKAAVKPAGALVVMDKRTGQIRRVPLR